MPSNNVKLLILLHINMHENIYQLENLYSTLLCQRGAVQLLSSSSRHSCPRSRVWNQYLAVDQLMLLELEFRWQAWPQLEQTLPNRTVWMLL